MAIPQGTKLGRYEIRSLLGAGGMGEVYLAYDLNLHRQVAVKVLRADLTTNEDRLQRFEREAYAASSLNHPNILTIYEIGYENNYQFIVTEFIEGESLGQQLQREPLLHEALRIGIQVASALGAAHAAGIVHRDIKPDNIMIRRDHLVKVLDFGLAKLSEPDSAGFDSEVLTRALPLTTPGVVMGTAHYMSPEQARGLPVDARTDTWSLGVILYRLVAGILPFAGNTMSDVIAAILTTEPPALTTFGQDVPREFDRIVTKALRKEREERYQSVKDLGLDLETLEQRLQFETELKRINSKEKGSGPDQAVRDPRPATTPVAGIGNDSEITRVHTTSSGEYVVRQMKRHRLGASLILATLLAAAIGLAYFSYSHYLSGNKRAGITSLAVLPFTNTGNDPEKEYLSEGISESLINRLSQLPGVKVIANSSSSRYKAQDADPHEVGTALGVTAVLIGRVLQRGDNLLISAELIDARDRTQLWGQQYNRKAADVLTVQAEISREIAQALRLRLASGQQQQIITPETVRPQAYELLLKGRFYDSKGGTENRKKALEYFHQAIAVDAEYALAYAELSDIYRSLIGSSVLEPKQYIPKAMAAAQKALELNEGLAEAHYALANMRTFAWEWEEAEREYKRTIELNPNLALAHRWYANYLGVMGRHEQAIDEMKRARELDPLSLDVNASIGNTLYAARRYDEAIEALKTALEMNRGYPRFHIYLGYAYAAKGMYPEAIAAYQEAIRLGEDSPSVQIFLGTAYALGGDRERARAMLKRLQTSKSYSSPGELAILYAALGDRLGAFSSLEQAYEAHDLQLQSLGIGPEYDLLRSDSRLQNLIRRVGLTP